LVSLGGDLSIVLHQLLPVVCLVDDDIHVFRVGSGEFNNRGGELTEAAVLLLASTVWLADVVLSWASSVSSSSMVCLILSFSR
jgi:hypothetical protein